MKRGTMYFGFRCFRVDPDEEDLFEDNDSTEFNSMDEALLREAGEGKKPAKNDLKDEPGHRGVDDNEPGAEGSGWDTRDPGK
jgi:hypothetical protein